MPDVYLGRPAGGPFGRSVALVAKLGAGEPPPPKTCFAISAVMVSLSPERR